VRTPRTQAGSCPRHCVISIESILKKERCGYLRLGAAAPAIPNQVDKT
jgi:hypothetical protein